MSIKKISLLSIGIPLIFLGCGEYSGNVAVTDSELSKIINDNNLSGEPSTGHTIPLISDAKAQLGMKLFFSKSLGGDKDTACVSCHHPALGGGDNLSLSIGVGSVDSDLLGLGRALDSSSSHYNDGLAPIPRNAPSTYNIALWDRSLFWDGRVESMTPTAGHNGEVGGISTPDSGFGIIDANAGANLVVAQARFPVTSAEEMKGFTFEVNSSNNSVRAHLAQRLSDDTAIDYITNTWEDEFESVYGTDSITFANIVDAIGEYERSQLFVNSPWKDYMEGNTNAISHSAKRGARLFFGSYEDDGMNCVECHSGDFFTDEDFHAMAIPQVGMGKGEGVTGDDDFGRFSVSGADKYAFRTPTLLNVEMTGPWGHSGAYTTLEAVVRHMVDPETAVAAYDLSQLDSTVKTTNTLINTSYALKELQDSRYLGVSPHKRVTTATDENIDDLVEFLKSLTDPCLKDSICIGKWIPDNEEGPDGLQLNAKDSSGNIL